MIDSITLLGSSSGRNAGDAALIAGIMDAVDQRVGKPLLYEIPTIRPSFIRDNYTNRTRPISMLPWSLSLKMFGVPTYQSLMRTDLSLIFDAILFDRSLYNPLFNYMSTLSILLPRMKKAGKKLGMYNVGTGPVDTPAGQRMLCDLANLMDFITVRDASSLKLLKDIGVTNPRILLGADAALTVRPSEETRLQGILKALGFTPEEEILGININAYLDTWASPKRESMGKDRFLAIYAAAINRFVKETGAPVMFVSTQHHDVPVTKDLMSRLAPGTKIGLLSNVDYNHYDIKGVMGKLSLLFGMRLHATILCSSALTPTLGIAYQPKVAHYFNGLLMPERCMSFNDFTDDSVYQHLISGWQDRKAIRAGLEKRIPVLQNEAYRPAEIVAALSRGEDLDHIISEQEGKEELRQVSAAW